MRQGMSLLVEFCGTQTEVPEDRPFVIGREADFVVDDNPFLHRSFLSLERRADLWLLTNIGDQLAATVSDSEGRLEAFLGPSAVLPIVFERTVLRFTAGPTSYELMLLQGEAAFQSSVIDEESVDGVTTIGRVTLTPDQRLLVLSLAESALRSAGGSAAVLPTSAQAADRLGWTVTKFNRKLDNVCDKLDKLGVRGLHGDSASLASNRRARLVEYVLAVRLVTREDLAVLDGVRTSAP